VNGPSSVHDARPDPNGRLKRLRALFSDEVPALLVSHVANIRYLLEAPTMFDDDFGGLLLVTQTTASLIADSRYSGQAKEADLVCGVEPASGSLWETLARLVKRRKLKCVGFESRYLTVAQWQQLKKVVPVELAPTTDLAERLRAVKEPAEIGRLTAAARIADEVFNDILNLLGPGLSEREVALEIDFKMRRAGADRSSFATIVATGPNSAYPHAGAGERRIQLGDLIKLDFGAVYKGYHSDMTRTVVLGSATDRQAQVYGAVLAAQTAALERLVPGLTGAEADALARNVFESIGMAKDFGHNLGHGVGLEVHELPTLGQKSEGRLEVGMVFTVEPGLYFPGFGGVRIEDMVVMRENGVQTLTTSAKQLIEI